VVVGKMIIGRGRRGGEREREREREREIGRKLSGTDSFRQ
jgi:hypothetical protein